MALPGYVERRQEEQRLKKLAKLLPDVKTLDDFLDSDEALNTDLALKAEVRAKIQRLNPKLRDVVN